MPIDEIILISLLSSISIFLSLNLFFKTNSKSSNINKILSIFFIQILILNLLFSNGAIGNPNNDFKDFLYQPFVKKLIKNNEILIIGNLNDKNLNLFKFYLPKYKLIKTTEIPQFSPIFGIISDKDILKLNDASGVEFINLKRFKDINLIKIN